MAKISLLPALAAPTGEETVVTFDGDQTVRVPVGVLARAAVAPVIDTAIGGVTAFAQAATLRRDDLYACQRIDDAYDQPNYAAVQFAALGASLGDRIDGVEIWLSVDANARTLVFDVYSRAADGPNAGAPIEGDLLLLSDRRRIADMTGGAGGGLTRRYSLDFLRAVSVDPTRVYLLRVTCLDAAEKPAAMGFARATGPEDSAPGYPQLNGLYTQLIAPTGWRSFGAGTAPAIRWQSVTRERAADAAGRIAALAIGRPREVTVGSPMTAPIGGDVTAIGTWLDAVPVVQGGTLSALWCHAASDGPVEIVFAERGAGDAFTIRHAIPVTLKAGENLLLPGGQFDAVAIQAGWHIGIRQAKPIARYGVVGTSLMLTAGGYRLYRNVALAVAARLRVTPTAERRGGTRQRRTSLWREVLASRTPIGWDIDPAILYTAGGLRLANPAGSASWSVRVHTDRWVRTDRRMTRALIDWTDAGSIVGLDTVGRQGDVIDARNANSLVLIDGAANTLKIMGAANGASDPGVRASVPLGFAMTVGHRYLLEYGLDGYVHSARLTDVTTSSRSPLVTAGDPDFVGIDTQEGRQVSALALAYHTGNASFAEIEVLHDGPAPRVVALGDSITQGVLVKRAQRWAGILQQEGVEVLVAAQASGITESARRCAVWEVRSTRPDFVIAAVGTNDMMLNIPVATYRFHLMDIINQARRVGARTILPILHPMPSPYNPEPYRAIVRELAQAEDVHLWRWDLALTKGGDGVTPDDTRLVADKIHPNAAGYEAMVNRLRADVPQIWD